MRITSVNGWATHTDGAYLRRHIPTAKLQLSPRTAHYI